MTDDRILNACRAAFPDREGLSFDATFPIESKSHAMLALQLTSSSHPPLPVIFREYTSPIGWYRLEDSGQAERERAILSWLHSQQFPVPTGYAAGQDADGEWMLMEGLPGQNWWTPMGMVDFGRTLPGVVKQHIAWMVRLHALDAEQAQSAIPTLPVISVLDVIDSYAEIAREVARREVSEGVLVASLRRLADMLADDEERPARLINGDAEVANILVRPEGGEIAGWIDWDEAAIGDPRWDVAMLVASLRGQYQMDELANWAIGAYQKDTVRPLRKMHVWTALIGVIRWAQSAWLQYQHRSDRLYNYPNYERFMKAHDSHVAWAMEMLNEAEAAEEGS